MKNSPLSPSLAASGLPMPGIPWGGAYLLALFLGCNACTDTQIEYAPFSPGVVHIRLDQAPPDSVFMSAMFPTNIPRGGSESKLIAAGNAGDYYLNLEIDRPAKGSLTLREETFNIIVFPNDTTHVSVNASNKGFDLGFYGNGSLINQYYLEKKDSLGYTDMRSPLNEGLSKATYHSVLQTTDAIVNRELYFLERYQSRRRLPEWFVDYEQAEIIYPAAGFKTFMPHGNELMGYFDDTLPEDYYDFLYNLKINNPKAVLSAAYFYFLDDYFLRDLPVAEFKDLSGYARISKIHSHTLKHSNTELSGQVKELYHRSNFSDLVIYLSDTSRIDSLSKAFQVSEYGDIARLVGTRSRNEIPFLRLSPGDTIPDFVLTTTLDSVVSFNEYKDRILYINFWATWCGPCIKNMPELNKLIERYQGNPEITFLNICLDSEHDRWLTSLQKYKLRGVNLFAQGAWNGKVRAYFNIKGIPHYAIVGRNNQLYENAAAKAPEVGDEIDEILKLSEKSFD